jgi:hypothetical protein
MPNTTKTASQPKPKTHATRYFCENPITHKFDEVFPESEIADTELVIPMFWAGEKIGYATVPGTEFYGLVPEDSASSK